MAKSSNTKKRQRVKGAASIRKKELPMFTRQLAAMLSSGMPLVQSITALEDQTSNQAFSEVLRSILQKVEGGSMYSEALADYPQVFDELYVNMMRAGESGGMLAETADRVAGFLEASNRLMSKVKSAMMYPTVVMIVAAIISSLLIMFIVPVFADMFSGFGEGLPAPTQALVDVSEFVKTYWYMVLAVVSGIVFGFRRYAKTEKGAYQIDLFKLKFPLLGDLTQKIAISRFAATFAQLLNSGVSIIEAMSIVGVATGNKVVGNAILDSRSSVEQGKTLSSALEGNPAFPKMLLHMLAAGEQTGKIDDMLGKLAAFYQEEVDTMLEGLSSMLEPLLMVVIGVVIGGIVICMFLPIFQMSQLVM